MINRTIGLKTCFAIILIFSSISLSAFGTRTDYFLQPQAGIWFGPVTPLGSTEDLVNISLGGGAFVRYNLPVSYLKIGLDASYQKFPSDGVNKLTFVPVYGSVLYLLPIDFPVKFQFKAGIGAAWVHIMPDDVSQWTPTYMLGAEFSFPAGRRVNIGLRIDYNCIFEKHLSGASRNGHILTSGIQVFFNL